MNKFADEKKLSELLNTKIWIKSLSQVNPS